jgi:S1-C subfamily serine protease
MSIENTEPHTDDEQQVPEAPRRKSRKPLIAISIATAAVVCVGGLGTAGIALLTRSATTETSMQSSQTTTPFGTHGRGSFGQQRFGQGGGPSQFGQSNTGQSYGSGASTAAAATASTASQKVGVVTINTVLDYTAQDQAAGTGMIISSDGLILTNNHVVEGSTSISVTVESTGKTYKATVVGTDQKADVAVLKLTGASGLSTVSFAPTATVTAGEAIYSVGNAEGTGNLVTAVGTVGATDQKLTIQGDGVTKAESLSGLIELNSDVVSGDSGGPLFDKAGDVIGIVTAASSGSSSVTGYAINIASVLKTADQIKAGTPTTDIVIGTPAFLGVALSTTSTVPLVSATFPGMPAAKAGIAAGSTITSFNGTKVTTASQLSALIASHSVGDRVTVTWSGTTGSSHTATVTLAAGPAA